MDSLELINFTKLSLDEKKMVLEWRNYPNIKKWMYSDSDIALEDHLNFIELLKNREDKQYYLVKNNNEYIGVIDFTNINTKATDIGLYANPELKRIGNILMKKIIDYSFNSLKVSIIYAEVFLDNDKAYSLYLRNGFKEFDRKYINKKEVICMELKR